MTREEFRKFVGVRLSRYHPDDSPLDSICSAADALISTHAQPQRESKLSRLEIAAMAMQGMIACPVTVGSYSEFAERAVGYADALIAELEKGGKDE